jgi:c-di-GMP-binding flagellar brake protein YcgR
MVATFASNKNSFPGLFSISTGTAQKDFYQQLQKFSNTIISIQYNCNVFLSFRVNQVQRGEIVYDKAKAIGVQCLLNGKTYVFTREHLDQMSNREQRELFDYLDVDDSQLF